MAKITSWRKEIEYHLVINEHELQTIMAALENATEYIIRDKFSGYGYTTLLYDLKDIKAGN